ncbi:MAG: tRNA uridine-5-carboxymethylaminomethyl(34) synthesis GTPase MnmE [Deltaproteobacteria bacterium RBG_13_49_15]|nr:MAG: tRNA uridine-5-carboxymethylaminomethyl(34) synthesis GTPase MnmE [Deltaproteobacteria bacterium RBG_13_49_15]
MDDSTIAAIATPVGCGGIGIIRISGSQAVFIASAVFQPSKAAGPFRSHRIYHGHVVNPESGRVLDEVFFLFMRAPRSYTREDVVEIHTHGGPMVLRAVLDLMLKGGARLAEAGEFTKRAFLNGRIDLSQAEAVIDLVQARTEKSLQIAAAQVKGALRHEVESIRKSLMGIQAEYEAAIDFPDETEGIGEAAGVPDRFQNDIIAPLEKMIEHYRTGHVFREGITLVIVGRPNVGKSSLMNCLVRKDRAIVSPMPGTTRDFIEEPLVINGIPVLVVDTAGLQDTHDPVEKIGIEKTMESIRASDLVLFVVEADPGLLPEDRRIFEEIKDKPAILVVNKTDLADPRKELRIPDAWRSLPMVKTSALLHRGIENLKAKIAATVIADGGIQTESPVIPNLRHKNALERALKAVLEAYDGFRTGRSPELVSMDLKEAGDALGGIMGEKADADLLDEIFSRFCIGK